MFYLPHFAGDFFKPKIVSIQTLHRMPIEFYVCPNFHFDIPLNNEILQVVIYPVFQVFAYSRFNFPQKNFIFWVTKAKKGCIASYNNWYFSTVLIEFYLAPQFHSDISLLKKVTPYFIHPILQVNVLIHKKFPFNSFIVVITKT